MGVPIERPRFKVRFLALYLGDVEGLLKQESSSVSNISNTLVNVKKEKEKKEGNYLNFEGTLLGACDHRIE